MPHAVVGLILVAHGLITTMIGFGSVTSPNAAAMPVPSWFNWWPGPFGRSWLFDALNLGPGLAAVGGLIWLVAGLTLIGAGLGWLGVSGAERPLAGARVRGRSAWSRRAGPLLPARVQDPVDQRELAGRLVRPDRRGPKLRVTRFDRRVQPRPALPPGRLCRDQRRDFLPYSWLHRTRAYVLLALVASFGPFAILVAGGAEVSFRTSGLLVGVVMVISAFYVRRSAERRIAVSAAPAVGSVPA
jgi:hypothetical protein